MKQLVLQKGTFIVVPPPFNGWAPGSYQNKCWICKDLFIGDKLARVCLECAVHVTDENLELIGLVSDILKDEEKAKMVVGEDEGGYEDFETGWNNFFAYATDAFQSLCTKYELKPTDLLIKKL